jgi:hypothetical protein
LAKTIGAQSAVLGLLGLGVGTGLGSAVGSIRLGVQLAIGGMLGGLLTALVYPAGVGFLLPNAQTEHVVPIESVSQLLWLAAASLLVAVVMTGLGGKGERRRRGAGQA